MNSSRPVRVLHLIDGLGGGGCERWLWDIVRLSDPKDFQHCVITIQQDSGDYVYAERLRNAGVYHQSVSRVLGFLGRNIQDLAVKKRLVPVRKSLTLGWRLGCYGLAAWELPKALMRFRPDVIHSHGYYGFVAGLIVRAISRRPLVHTVPALFSQMKDARLGWTPAVYARMHCWVDRFFTGASYNELLSVGIPASKVSLVQGSADLEAISAVKNERDRYHAEIRRSLGLPEDACMALSVGRLHSSKGHLFALDALSLLRDQFANLHLVVLGEGLQRVELEARAGELGITEHVHFIGFKAEPLPYYAAADIYLRTPVFEAENLSSFQAIAMGLPIVGFDTSCETELIDKVGNGILVPNRDGAALAHAIASVLMLSDRGKAMGELGAEYGRNHLDSRQVTSLFFSVYESVTKGGVSTREALK